jgi:ankyrin repeat protein
MNDILAEPLVGGHRLAYYFEDPKIRSLLSNVAAGHLDRARQDVANGADVNEVGKDGITPLLWLMTTGFNAEKIEFLLAAGADPNYIEPKSRMSAVYGAASSDRPDILELLLKYKGNPDERGPQGKTALMAAVAEGRPSNVDILLRHGADLNARDALQLSAPEIAISRNRYDMAYMLLDKGYSKDLDRLARFAADIKTTPGSVQAQWRERLVQRLKNMH